MTLHGKGSVEVAHEPACFLLMHGLCMESMTDKLGGMQVANSNLTCTVSLPWSEKNLNQ